MQPAEELRYLILAIQREGNRLLAAELRPLGVSRRRRRSCVLADHQPLTLYGLGELLVCETGSSPSRLVDRLVAARLVNREQRNDDRRHLVLTLTEHGAALAQRIAAVERAFYRRVDELTGSGPVDDALALLRQFAGAFPTGQALLKRRELRAAV